MVLSYEPVRNRLNKGDQDVDSSEIDFLNPYLIVGVENLLWYGEILDGFDITVIIDQESDGLKPRTFEELYPMFAEPPTTTAAPNVSTSTTTSTTTSRMHPLNSVTMAALLPNLNSSTTTTPLETTTRTPLAPIPEESSISTSTSVPLAAKPNAEETEKLFALLQAFSAVQNGTLAAKPGAEKDNSPKNLDAFLAELNNSIHALNSTKSPGDLSSLLAD